MRNRLIAWWSGLTFALTIFLSAFLLFEVQPILSKFILPWFGGSPMVWTTCMVFFQTVLFGGYLYAHLIQQWLGSRWQAAVHLALSTAAVFLLPIAPDAAWKPLEAGSPTWRIIALLAVSVGLPYFILSTTGPLVQSWFSRTFPGRSPYRLYALSNCRGETEIVLGEGRLSLEHEPPQHFNLLVLDAFSGDAIPAHLLTKEAFEVFRRQLKPQGAIAVHISNRYLNLAPVVCGVGKALGLTPLAFESAGDPAASKFPAQWIVLSDNPELIAKYPDAIAAARQVRDLPHGCWTDDRSNLFEILK